MAQCVYCGRPAGFFRKMHKECHLRHQRAITLIPGFFPKFFQSNLPIDRFRQLLQSATEASFIRPDELKNLTTAGLAQVINTVLERHLLANDDTTRVLAIADALAPILSDDVRPYELLAKIDILRGLPRR